MTPIWAVTISDLLACFYCVQHNNVFTTSITNMVHVSGFSGEASVTLAAQKGKLLYTIIHNSIICALPVRSRFLLNITVIVTVLMTPLMLIKSW